MTLFFILLLGLCFGSFANVVIVRLPHGHSIWRTRSQCPHCHTAIAAYDNIPLVSYMLLRGKCRSCRHPISFHYPAVEALSALGFAFAYWRYGAWLPLMVMGCFFVVVGLMIIWIDYQHRIIPDEISLGLLTCGLLGSWWNPFLAGPGSHRLTESFAAGFCAGAFFYFMSWAGEKVFKKEALGGGDIKLLAAYGAVTGWVGAFSSLMIGSFLGGLFGVALLCSRKKQWGETLPFGPFLVAGHWVGFFFPTWWKFFM